MSQGIAKEREELEQLLLQEGEKARAARAEFERAKTKQDESRAWGRFRAAMRRCEQVENELYWLDDLTGELEDGLE